MSSCFLLSLSGTGNANDEDTNNHNNTAGTSNAEVFIARLRAKQALYVSSPMYHESGIAIILIFGIGELRSEKAK